jgi:hypothetical protein
MNQGLLTGEEFNKYISEIYLDEQKKYVTERLLKLTKDEQQFVVTFFECLYQAYYAATARVIVFVTKTFIHL